MKVHDPGHQYELASIDSEIERNPNWLRFVKRIGDKYPGNLGPAFGGTTTQEVLRALIDRTKYVDRQEPHPENARVLNHLRAALWALERRAAQRAGDPDRLTVNGQGEIETWPVCSRCGHVRCKGHP